MPIDTTPDPRDMQRLPEAQAIPEPVPGGKRKPAPVDMAERPPLPDPPDPATAEPPDETAAPPEDEGKHADGLVAGDGVLNRR